MVKREYKSIPCTNSGLLEGKLRAYRPQMSRLWCLPPGTEYFAQGGMVRSLSCFSYGCAWCYRSVSAVPLEDTCEVQDLGHTMAMIIIVVLSSINYSRPYICICQRPSNHGRTRQEKVQSVLLNFALKSVFVFYTIHASLQPCKATTYRQAYYWCRYCFWLTKSRSHLVLL